MTWTGDEAVIRVEGTRGSNVYLVIGERLTLVDTGLGGNERAILRAIQALDRKPDDLAFILLTHHHRDHTGSAEAIRDLTGARVIAHRAEVGPDGAIEPGRRRRRTSVPVDQTVEDGEVLDNGMVVVHTPGHTKGSACYLVPERKSLFLGDVAINNLDRLSRPLPYSNIDAEAYEASLRKIATLDASEGYFGHGPPLRDGLQEALRELIERPRAPTWLRLLRGWRDLVRFGAGMRRD